MEPKILLIGRKMEVIGILIDELEKFERDVVGSNEKDKIADILQSKPIDFVVMGVGLPEEVREEITDYIHKIIPGLVVHKIEKMETSSPYNMISFINRKAVEFKVEQKLGKRPHK